MECRICKSEAPNFAKAAILSRYKINYYLCGNCGLLQTEQPYWLSEVYKESINLSDTGILQRNISLSKNTAVLLNTFFAPNYKCLDYAGGYGIFCRLMRDMGFDFFWQDPYTKNLFARGFEYDDSIKIDFLTSFESLEHFAYPLAEFEKMMNISDTILVTTLCYPTPPPAPGAWWYYGLDHGQHIAFYSAKTLKYIANYFSLNFFTDGDHLHLFAKKIPRIKNLNLFLRYKYLIVGSHKINRLINESDKIFPYLHHRFPASRTVADMNLLGDQAQNYRGQF